MKDMMELDLSKFDMNDFADMMKAIKKIGIMQWMKQEMSEPQHGGDMKMEDESPEEEAEEFSEFVPTEKEEMSDEMEDMPMKPKKKEYTMFSVKSDNPKMQMEKEVGNKAMGRAMLKKMMGK